MRVLLVCQAGLLVRARYSIYVMHIIHYSFLTSGEWVQGVGVLSAEGK
jgi:hypothetical protein